MNRLRVLAAAGLIVVLAALLGARISARPSVGDVPHAAPAAATVPQPAPIVVSDLPTPFCWGCSWNREAPLRFQMDLDLLAPLGNGPDNAAVWLAGFAEGGVRYVSDGREIYGGRLEEVRVDGDTWRVLPGDDPLLLEAEAWVDQARCRFYPDVWKPAGVKTEVPDLLLTLHLSRSWVARGKLSDDPREARRDFRRAIRLGRLLRQDDVTIIQDLVAIANIRIGAQALYELAREEGDAGTMVVAALTLTDKDAMRQHTARWITTFESAFRPGGPSGAEMDSMVELLGALSERRFRMEGLISMQAVKHVGTPDQRERAEAVLDGYAAGDDELLAGTARHFLDTTLEGDELKSFMESMTY